MPSGLYARLCHAFSRFIIFLCFVSLVGCLRWWEACGPSPLKWALPVFFAEVGEEGGRDGRRGTKGSCPSKPWIKKIKLSYCVTYINELTIKQLIYIAALCNYRHIKTQKSVQLQGGFAPDPCYVIGSP